MKSTVDYDGVYKGRAVYCEAKSTKETNRFPLNNISRHQIDYLKDKLEHGAICLMLIEFRTDHIIYHFSQEDSFLKEREGAQPSE
ncbi:hypothetical protein COL21_31195 [Bacillus thuringiensis]|nr:hypothetical protein COL21_31195 [Bacillus thuringiensis]PGR90502.1 hypothetical protein COC68_26115 [Bacillus thuringiensis]